MKILFLTEFFPARDDGKIPGGSESRTYYLAKELLKMNQSVTVLTAYLPKTKRKDNWGGIEIIRVGPRYDYIQSGSNFSRLLFAISCIAYGFFLTFDIVDANNTAVYMAAFVLAKARFKKVIYWVPDVLGMNGWIKALGSINGLINAFNESLCLTLGADKIIALSKTTSKKIHQPLIVIYPGIEQVASSKPVFPPSTIISVNRLVDYKRVDLVIRALAQLRDKGISLRYKVIGEGKEKNRLVTLVKKLKLIKNVKFLGTLSKYKVLQEISNAQIFCLASEIEGFGIVTLEAMSFGLPFLNSNIPVHKEISEISNSGLLFEPGDENDLAKKLENIIKNKSLYLRLSKNALEFSRKHTWKQVALDTLNVYKNI